MHWEENLALITKSFVLLTFHSYAKSFMINGELAMILNKVFIISLARFRIKKMLLQGKNRNK